MLAAAISESEETVEPVSKTDDLMRLPKTTVTSDDVLDIKMAVRKMKLGVIKSLGSQKSRKRSIVTVSKITSPKFP